MCGIHVAYCQGQIVCLSSRDAKWLQSTDQHCSNSYANYPNNDLDVFHSLLKYLRFGYHKLLAILMVYDAKEQNNLQHHAHNFCHLYISEDIPRDFILAMI